MSLFGLKDEELAAVASGMGVALILLLILAVKKFKAAPNPNLTESVIDQLDRDHLDQKRGALQRVQRTVSTSDLEEIMMPSRTRRTSRYTIAKDNAKTKPRRQSRRQSEIRCSKLWELGAMPRLSEIDIQPLASIEFEAEDSDQSSDFNDVFEEVCEIDFDRLGQIELADNVETIVMKVPASRAPLLGVNIDCGYAYPVVSSVHPASKNSWMQNQVDVGTQLVAINGISLYGLHHSIVKEIFAKANAECYEDQSDILITIAPVNPVVYV